VVKAELLVLLSTVVVKAVMVMVAHYTQLVTAMVEEAVMVMALLTRHYFEIKNPLLAALEE
jgi:hypothetical protein